MAKSFVRYIFLYSFLVVLSFVVNVFLVSAAEFPEFPCAGVTCGEDSYCFEGSCKCSGDALNCDGAWNNGCECGGLNTTCSNISCVCKTGYKDCDGNMQNGCEVGGNVCPPCTPGQTRTCTEGDICNGKQTCGLDGYWGFCTRTTPQICTPGATSKCTPTVDGKKCSTLSGTIKCNSCGSKWSSCSAPSDIVCCPGSQAGCTIGACTGVKVCSEDGKVMGSCVAGDATCCAQDSECDDFNSCTTEKCTDNKCEYLQKEDCQSLTPVKCKDDNGCASTASCVGGICSPLKCNEKFVIDKHKCTCEGKECNGECYFTDGVCCGGFWNEDFDSCFFDFSYYKERVNIANDREAKALMEEAENIVMQGDLRKVTVLVQIAFVKSEVVLSVKSEEIKNKTLMVLKEAKDLLDSGNYSLAMNKADEAMSLLEGEGVKAEVKVPSLWEEKKVPIIIFSSVIVLLLLFILYVILTPKI